MRRRRARRSSDVAAALVVIDVQQGLFPPSRPAYRGAEVVTRIAALLARARARRVPIFHIQHDGGPGHILARGSAGWAVHEAVCPIVGEPVIEKRHCSAFQETDLYERLVRAGIDKIVLAGLQTEYCVDTTCRAASALGFRIILASDAHTTFDTNVLSAAQIIAHHNHTLDGFVELAAAAEIDF
jgi:nicotinamidase-related amidase